MIILLYTAATPFSPVAWLTSEMEGAMLFDRLVAGALLFAALYFQWRVAAQTAPVAICIPTGGGSSGARVSGGRLAQSARAEGFAWLYRPSEYWTYVGVEAAMLVLAEFGGFEVVRRGLVSVVILGLWAVGWFVTPEHIKREGWSYLKQLWFWIALDEVMRVGQGRSRRRRF
jgi:hypothetical protein